MLPTSSAGGLDGSAIAFPAGYRWEFGGEKFEQDKGFKSLSIALIVSFVAIYLALVLQFNSATQPILVYAAVPFGFVEDLHLVRWETEAIAQPEHGLDTAGAPPAPRPSVVL